MLHVHGLEKHYGARTVLDGVSLHIGPGEHVGLVGRNGCGKSTLLRMLAGADAEDGGASHRAARRGLTVGYLPQMPDLEPEAELLEAALCNAPPDVQEWEARRALLGLGFRAGQLTQRAGTLSGGEKTRLMLARLLLGGHDLLLLDEPTSHLDARMLEWLEGYLRGYRGAFLVASHDRRFLDRTVTRIVELDDGRLGEYAGGYTAYATARQARIERQHEDYVLQQRQIRALREFVGRQMQWADAGQAGPKRGRDQRGRIAEKSAKRAHAAERRIDHMELVAKPHDSTHVNAAFRADRRSGQVVAELQDVSMAFGARTLYAGVTTAVAYGDRIGIVGPNGAGKTTLLRLLLGEAEPTGGLVRRGAAVAPCYLAQEQEQLDPELTVLETVEAAGRLSHTEARTLLACFLFREAEVFKQVGDLSGGERVRLAVACAVVSGANLLVLDEPTNHLDIDTRERLEDALAAYDGTLLVVSHDRYLLDRLARRLFVLGDGAFEDYPGAYTEWEERRSLQEAATR